MSLIRAFTTRRSKHAEPQISSPMHIGRAASMRAGRPVARGKISSPVALLTTSNALLNNAENIPGTMPIDIRSISGSSASSTSGEDSDASTGSIHSRETATDASSVECESPISAEPEPNHLSCYFKPAVDTQTKSPSHSPSISPSASFDAPRIPQRVPSHSKKAHENLHRKRSVQRMMSPPPSSHGEAYRGERLRTSTEMFTTTLTAFVEAPKEGPFGNELAQLDEVAEEFGQVVRSAEADADSVAMQAHGLAHFAASDYMSEIQSLIYETFADEEIAAWI